MSTNFKSEHLNQIAFAACVGGVPEVKREMSDIIAAQIAEFKGQIYVAGLGETNEVNKDGSSKYAAKYRTSAALKKLKQ